MGGPLVPPFLFDGWLLRVWEWVVGGSWFDKLTMRVRGDEESEFCDLNDLQCWRLALHPHSPSW